MNKLNSIYSSAYAASVTILLVVVMTLAAELSAPFKAWLAGFTGHHWVTKSWISLIVFFVSYGFLRMTKKSVNEGQTRKGISTLEMFAVLGFLAILGFYLYEFYKH